MNSSKKRMNEFVFTTMRRVFVRFLEEIEDIKKGISKLTDLQVNTPPSYQSYQHLVGGTLVECSIKQPILVMSHPVYNNRVQDKYLWENPSSPAQWNQNNSEVRFDLTL